MAKTTNEEIFDAAVRHQIYLLRYASEIRNHILEILDKSEAEMVRHIRDRLATLSELRSEKDWAKLQKLQSKISDIRASAWVSALTELTDKMVELVFYEPKFMAQTTGEYLPVQVDFAMPSRDMLKAIVHSRPFEGELLKGWAATMQKDDISRIQNAIQVGMIGGETTPQIVKRVVGTSELAGSDGITQMTRNQVNTVVRTAVQFVANSSRDTWFELNRDIISGELYVATLDSRTTPICRALDGKIFQIGKGPRPPVHFNCRSLRVPAIDGGRAGSRPFKPTTEKMLAREYAQLNKLDGVTDRDSLPKGSKTDFDAWARKRTRELIGQVPAKTDYDTWLRTQKKEFQDEVLGIKRAELFRKGMKLDRFVDNVGNELTLEEIYKREGIKA